LTTSKDGESALSPQIEAHVEAADDAPVVLADPVPAVDEGGTASLHADATDADGDAIDRFEWKQVGGPPVELFNSSSRSPTLIAPNAAADYALEFEVRAVTATNISAAKRVSVDVRAVNEPPRVTIEAPARGEAGESVVLTAHVEDPEQSSALRYEWSRAGDGTAIAFDDAHASTVHASLPEGNGDYPLEIALRVTDGSLAPVAATTSIAVASDAALAPLARGEMRVWIKADREVPIAEENSGPAGWDNPGDKLAFSHNGDGWLLASARNSAGALVRPLPRGEYEIAGLMESQGLKTKTCGVRFVSDDSHGVAVCIVSADDGARTVVSYATEKGADGAWSAPENTTLIGPWKRDDAIQFVFVWHKGELSVNWGKPGGSVSSQKLDIASRPRRIALFVAGGQSALFDWKIAGL
jgi:hypothetical protein